MLVIKKTREEVATIGQELNIEMGDERLCVCGTVFDRKWNIEKRDMKMCGICYSKLKKKDKKAVVFLPKYRKLVTVSRPPVGASSIDIEDVEKRNLMAIAVNDVLTEIRETNPKFEFKIK